MRSCTFREWREPDEGPAPEPEARRIIPASEFAIDRLGFSADEKQRAV